MEQEVVGSEELEEGTEEIAGEATVSNISSSPPSGSSSVVCCAFGGVYSNGGESGPYAGSFVIG